MVSRAAHAILAALTVFAPTAAGEAFLSTRYQSVSKEAIEDALMQELPDSANVATIKNEMFAMYESLPKNEQGHLEPAAVRYALHRYFVHKYGWYVKGLDVQGEASRSMGSTEVMKGLAPSFILGLFEQRLHGRGLALEELAVFAATLGDLIFQEGLGSLQEVYAKLELPTSEPVTEAEFDQAIRAYFAQLVVGQWNDFQGPKDFKKLEEDAREVLAEYDETMMWAMDLRKSRDYADRSSRNPFKHDSSVSFERGAQHLLELMQHFGALTKEECTSTKEQLQEMEAPGTGRVLLSDFYANKKLVMHESVAYLRNLGVLEEEGLRSPRLITANYITSMSRCYPFSSYFSICCHDECEDLMGNLESAVKAPHATPARIAEVVSGISTSDRPAMGNISTKLMHRLEEIASRHDGQVPLHGRLFMQWMHHAFPQDCAFPHVSGTTNPVTQDEWLVLPGHEDLETVLAPESDIEHHIAQQHPDVHAGLDDLPWTAVEELVAVDKPSRQPRSRTSRVLRAIMGLIAVVSFALPLVHGSRALFAGASAEEKTAHLV